MRRIPKILWSTASLNKRQKMVPLMSTLYLVLKGRTRA